MTKPKNHEILLLWIPWLIISGISLWLHEPWRDELHSWTLVKSASTLAELFEFTRYEGHPSLWYLILYVFKPLSSSILGLKLIHFIISASAVYLFLRNAPFSTWIKGLCVFGYFFLFEYSVLARNYAIGLLLLFAFCAHYTKQRGKVNLVFLGCVVAALAFTSIYGLLFSILLFLLIDYDYILPKQEKNKNDNSVLKLFPLILFMVIAIAVAIIDIKPPSDTGFASAWKSDYSFNKIMKSLSAIWDAWIPIPKTINSFWNSNILQLENTSLSFMVRGILGFGLFLLALFSLLKTMRMRLFLLVGTLLMLMFMHVKYHGFLRHHGHLYILLWIAIWLENGQGLKSKWGKILAILLLSIQAVCGLFAVFQDWTRPFTAAEASEKYILEQGLQNHFLIGDLDFTAAGLAGRLNREMYFPIVGKESRFCVWDMNRAYKSPTQVMAEAKKIASQKDQAILLILSYKLNPDLLTGEIIIHPSFEESIEPSERYYLYEIR